MPNKRLSPEKLKSIMLKKLINKIKAKKKLEKKDDEKVEKVPKPEEQKSPKKYEIRRKFRKKGKEIYA